MWCGARPLLCTIASWGGRAPCAPVHEELAVPARIPYATVPEDAPIHNNLVRAAHHNPEMFRGFGSLSMRVHTASGLSDRERELAVLRTVVRLGAAYEWSNHVVGARRAGIGDDEIRAVRAGDLAGFSESEQALLALAEAIEDRTVDDAVWSRARAVFSDAQLVDLTMLAGFYGFASRFVMALDLPLDEGMNGLDVP
jgi:4-carboxymuconolactone decarboxylase